MKKTLLSLLVRTGATRVNLTQAPYVHFDPTRINDEVLILIGRFLAKQIMSANFTGGALFSTKQSLLSRVVINLSGKWASAIRPLDSTESFYRGGVMIITDYLSDRKIEKEIEELHAKGCLVTGVMAIYDDMHIDGAAQKIREHRGIPIEGAIKYDDVISLIGNILPAGSGDDDTGSTFNKVIEYRNEHCLPSTAKHIKASNIARKPAVKATSEHAGIGWPFPQQAPRRGYQSC